MPGEMSLMCNENKKGSRTVPCGAPDTTHLHSDYIPLTTSFCCHKDRKVSSYINFDIFPPIDRLLTKQLLVERIMFLNSTSFYLTRLFLAKTYE